MDMTPWQHKRCTDILKELKKNPASLDFRYPVPYQEMRLFDYPEIIKNPMDLSTVDKKLKARKYETVDDFVSDINLIFSNCYLYNGPPGPMAVVSEHAAKLEEVFKNALAKLPVVVSGFSQCGHTSLCFQDIILVMDNAINCVVFCCNRNPKWPQSLL